MISTIKQLIYAPGFEQNRPAFLLADDRLYRSNDNGRTWRHFDLPAGVVPASLAISPNFTRDRQLFVGTARGEIVTVKIGE